MKYFASYRFDVSLGVLSESDHAIPLTRKAAALLRCLIQHAPDSASHDEILAFVWPGIHVQPDNIKVLIREIRHALADDPHEPRFIKCDPGRGYAFIAAVADAALPLGGSRTELVGTTRGPELGALQDRLAAARSGTPQMVFVSGERGAGRTSLCEAFMARAAAGGALVGYAQGLEAAGAAEPYGVIHDLLLQLRERYPERVDDVLSRYPGALPRGLAGRRKAPWAVARAVRDICHVICDVAANVPVVLVVDDLQWCDRYTFDVLRALARWRGTPARVLVICTCAPAPAGRVSVPLRDLLLELCASGASDTIQLRPLDKSRIGRVLAGRFGAAVAAAIGGPVHDLSGGHPAIVAAVMNHLASGAGMGLPVSYWRTADRAALTAVLQQGASESIVWRFANLDRADRAVLETAAVIGTTFTAADVAIGLGLNLASARERLERVAHWELILPVGAGTGVYRFWHPLHAELAARGAPGFDLLRAAASLSRRRDAHRDFG